MGDVAVRGERSWQCKTASVTFSYVSCFPVHRGGCEKWIHRVCTPLCTQQNEQGIFT